MMPLVVGAIIGAVTAAAQAASAAHASKKQREFNRKEAAKTRKFQAHQSATTAQRGVKDLRAAGLNPILAAGGQFSAPAASGATASASTADTNAIGQTGIAATRLYQELENLKATEEKTKAEKTAVDTKIAIDAPEKYKSDLIMKAIYKAEGSLTGADRNTKALQVRLWNAVSTNPQHKFARPNKNKSGKARHRPTQNRSNNPKSNTPFEKFMRWSKGNR